MRGILAYSVKPLAVLITCHVQLYDLVLNGLLSAYSPSSLHFSYRHTRQAEPAMCA